MINERTTLPLSDFFRFLVEQCRPGDGRVPALTELSQQLGVSVASLREQMEVARALGLVEVRPRTGIRRLPYTFRPAVTQSLIYAISADARLFDTYSDLRSHIEAAYWHEAVSLLTPDDHQALRELIRRAREKLGTDPVQMPQAEHRELHLLIYSRLNNPFVTGLLEAYWELYEAVGLGVYTDLIYLKQVWEYHGRMVEDICSGNFQDGYQALLEHVHLISQRRRILPRMNFE